MVKHLSKKVEKVTEYPFYALKKPLNGDAPRRKIKNQRSVLKKTNLNFNLVVFF